MKRKTENFCTVVTSATR